MSASDSETLKDRRYGSVMSHAIHLGKHGKVFWQIRTPGSYIPEEFNYPNIKKGYFYLTSIQRVFYACDIEFIKKHDEIDDPDKFIYYVPEWRMKNWRSQEEENWGYWISIEYIQELRKQHTIDEFVCFSTKKPLIAPPQAYSIIIDPKFETV